MRKIIFVMLLGFLTQTSLFAASERLVLSCEERFSGLEALNFYAGEKGIIFGKQSYRLGNKHYVKKFSIDAVSWERKEGIELPEWYGYKRTLTHVHANQWRIDYEDECSSKSIDTVCTFY